MTRIQSADQCREQIAHRRRFQQYQVAPRLQRNRPARALSFLDRSLAEPFRVKAFNVLEIHAAPTSAGAIAGPRRNAEQRPGGSLMSKKTFAARHGRTARADVKKSRGGDLFARSQIHDRFGEARHLLRPGFGGGIEVSTGRQIALLPQRRHELWVRWRELRDLLGFAHGGGDGLLCEFVASGRTRPRAKAGVNGECQVILFPVGGDAVEGKSEVAPLMATERDHARIRFGKRQCFVGDLPGFSLRNDHNSSQGGRARLSSARRFPCANTRSFAAR